MKIEIETKFSVGDKVQVNEKSPHYQAYKGRAYLVDKIEVAFTIGIAGLPQIKVWVRHGDGYGTWFYESNLEPYVPKKHYVITFTQDGSVINSAANTTWYSSMQEAIKAVQEHQERTMLDKSIRYIIGYDPNKE